MLRINGILGYLSDAVLSEKVHSLQHQGRLEILLIQPQDVARHRLRSVTDKGNECQILRPEPKIANKELRPELLLSFGSQELAIRSD